MHDAIEMSIIENLHCLNDSSKAEVLDFVECLASKSKLDDSSMAWLNLEPEHYFVPFQCALKFDEDAFTSRRRVRDSELV